MFLQFLPLIGHRPRCWGFPAGLDGTKIEVLFSTEAVFDECCGARMFYKTGGGAEQSATGMFLR